ncbi:amidohydrolase family protein [Sphingomonas bisphenolicum]
MNDDLILDPSLPIVDAHHHLWSVSHQVGGRSGGAYLAAEFAADLACGHNIQQTIFVECDQHYRTDGPEGLRPVGETEFVVEQAASLPQFPGACAGIAGYANLALGKNVGAVLDEHITEADGRFRSIRHRAWHDDDPIFAHLENAPPRDLLDDPTFREGFSELAPRQLAFDAMVLHPQLDLVGRLAAAFPDTQIALNHLGGLVGIGNYASRRKESVADWKAGMSRLAAHKNVWLKMSGLGFFLGGSPLMMREPEASLEEIAEEWGPLIRYGIEEFGPERCMFASNFPPDSATCSYKTLWNVFKLVTADYSDADRRWLFADTARKVYRLDDMPATT